MNVNCKCAMMMKRGVLWREGKGNEEKSFVEGREEKGNVFNVVDVMNVVNVVNVVNVRPP